MMPRLDAAMNCELDEMSVKGPWNKRKLFSV